MLKVEIWLFNTCLFCVHFLNRQTSTEKYAIIAHKFRYILTPEFLKHMVLSARYKHTWNSAVKQDLVRHRIKKGPSMTRLKERGEKCCPILLLSFNLTIIPERSAFFCFDEYERVSLWSVEFKEKNSIH